VHQLAGGVSAADHGAGHGGRIVDADGLTRQEKPVVDRFLEPAPIVQTGSGCVE
jgi:hypothetical protein